MQACNVHGLSNDDETNSTANDTEGQPSPNTTEPLPPASYFGLKENSSVLDYLDTSLLDDPETLRDLSESLQNGNLAIIKEAFQPEFAELVWSAMTNEEMEWVPFVVTKNNGHNFMKHRPVNRGHVLSHIHNIFNHPASKGFFSKLVGRHCDGNVVSLPSWYQVGDHSNPHNDDSSFRELTFLWQLSKDWKPEWGGAFYWSSAFYTNSYQHSNFNTLILFSVTTRSTHGVTPVISGSEGHRRLNFGGWYSKDVKKNLPPKVDELDIYNSPESRAQLTHAEALHLVRLKTNSLADLEQQKHVRNIQERILDERLSPSIEESVYVSGFQDDDSASKSIAERLANLEEDEYDEEVFLGVPQFDSDDLDKLSALVKGMLD
jgi:hypothetical protein